MNAIILILGFVGVGLWLEGVNGKHGAADEFFTPLPLGILGCVIAIAERGMA